MIRVTEETPEKIECNEGNSEDKKLLATGESDTKKSDKSAMQTIG